MPILSLNDNPPSRYPNQDILDSSQTWWIAKVKPRMEKALAKDLLDRGVEYYLPYYENVTRRTDCRALRKSLLPLFPSYVPFACEKEPWQLLQLNSISTILPITAQKRFKQELNQIYFAYEKNIPIRPPKEREYLIGERVRVVAGPLCGLCGCIINLKGNDCLLLRVEGLGEACVSIDSLNVESIKT
ncbi:MAG: transcription termination/antitermination NusG family protein [Chitinispirillaceae bacterium]